MSKGSTPRPFSNRTQYESNFDAIFRGVPERSKGDGSNPSAAVGSNPTPAATYIDNATGKVVDEAWWPDTTNTGIRPPNQEKDNGSV